MAQLGGAAPKKTFLERRGRGFESYFPHPFFRLKERTPSQTESKVDYPRHKASPPLYPRYSPSHIAESWLNLGIKAVTPLFN